jgi:ABC-type uncharacterized transport system fused permease/ATPase subunit
MQKVGLFLVDRWRLIDLNFQRQRFEANFRFALVRVRENAEGIALYSGEQREAESLNLRFADIFANGCRVLRRRRSTSGAEAAIRHDYSLHRPPSGTAAMA